MGLRVTVLVRSRGHQPPIATRLSAVSTRRDPLVGDTPGPAWSEPAAFSTGGNGGKVIHSVSRQPNVVAAATARADVGGRERGSGARTTAQFIRRATCVETRLDRKRPRRANGLIRPTPHLDDRGAIRVGWPQSGCPGDATKRP